MTQAGYLERLAEPLDLVERDETGLQIRESLVDISAMLIADGQSAGAVEPGVAALDHPAMRSEPDRWFLLVLRGWRWIESGR